MSEKKEVDRELLMAWVKAGITHLTDTGTMGSLVEERHTEQGKTIVTMTMVLPVFLGPLVRREIETIMDGVAQAMKEGRAAMDAEEHEQSITKH